MGGASQALYFLLHPYELKSVVQWKVWHDPVHKRDLKKETRTEKSCFHYLDLTSRSFSTVIQELNPELLMPITLFYLVLRALDTVEDDMTLDLAVKEPILRDFHNLMEKDGWTFDKNGPNEKDRDLLVHFDDIITELKNVKKPYHAVIKDIAEKMGNGMADYAVKAEKNESGVDTIADYELYCHYVAGLVGEGLTRLFVESKLANPQLLVRMDLTESMGQFLQKTNIIRDVHEDFVDGRRFWPKEIWSKHVDKWEDIFKPENREKALNCSSEMVLNALKHADECLYYMAGVRDQSVFNFVAIPQSMAIATLELVFRNPAVFERNIKITKGDACQLMTESTQSLRVVCDVFRQYARRIHAKNDPRDPLFLEISAQCAKIEQFIESIFPTQDPKKLNAIATQAQKNGINMSTIEVFVLISSALFIMLSIGGMMVGAAYLMGARWGPSLDALGEQVRESSATAAAEAIRKAIPTSAGHSEL